MPRPAGESAGPAAHPQRTVAPGSVLEVLAAFGKLGVSSFGGPNAHLGYFRAEFVTRRRWLDEAGYADLVALCQLLPGPASSQVGFSIGLMRAGFAGALAAWCAFTLPSAALMVAFASGARTLGRVYGFGLMHGLQLAAVAIVAQAVASMAAALCPDRERAGIALAALLIVLFGHSSSAQILAIAAGGGAGMWLCRGAAGAVLRAPAHVPLTPRAGVAALGLFFVLLIALPLLRQASGSPTAALVEAFYRCGALVFGGGHVVLPLLRDALVPGWIDDRAFLSGYGAAQALPGPLFAFAAYLGATLSVGPGGIGGAALALGALYLPGILVLLAALPFWEAVRRSTRARAMLAGVNAAVVGLLAAALYDPIWTTSVRTRGDFALAATGFVLLSAWRTSPLIVVALCALGGVVLDELAL